MSSPKTLFLSAIRGPIILITLGSLFALDYFGPLRFTRTWPVLLIVFGLLKLLERLSNGNAQAPAGGLQ